jgi:hypothetical protein
VVDVGGGGGGGLGSATTTPAAGHESRLEVEVVGCLRLLGLPCSVAAVGRGLLNERVEAYDALHEFFGRVDQVVVGAEDLLVLEQTFDLFKHLLFYLLFIFYFFNSCPLLSSSLTTEWITYIRNHKTEFSVKKNCIFTEFFSLFFS